MNKPSAITFRRSYRPNLQRKKMSWLKWKKEKVEAKSSICHHTLKSSRKIRKEKVEAKSSICHHTLKTSSKTKTYQNMNDCSHKLMNCHSQKCWTTTTFIIKAVSDNLPWLLRLHQLLVLGCRQVYNNSPRFPGKPITQTCASWVSVAFLFAITQTCASWVSVAFLEATGSLGQDVGQPAPQES